MPVDLLQVDMTRTWEILGEITGDAAPDELITQLFSQFCYYRNIIMLKIINLYLKMILPCFSKKKMLSWYYPMILKG